MPGLEINWFRQDKGHNPDVIRKSLQKRFRDPKLVDEVITLDQQWRGLRFQIDELKKQWNETGRLIKDKKIANKEDPCQQEIGLKNQNEEKQKAIADEERLLLKKIHLKINSCGNLVHESVPVSNNENENVVIRKWGELSKIKITGKRGGLHHHQVLQAIGGYDPQRGQNIAGHRGYFLKGPGVLLNQALINYGCRFLLKEGYQLVQPPFFLKRQIMAETCQLDDFDDQLYKVIAGNKEEDQYYLIATSQQPLSAMHRQEWMDEATLPIKYGGISSCFRKEAGAHGKDTWGIFRIHQFEKVQQFLITKPQQSWQAFEKMISQSELFYQSLGLPYQVIAIVSGALNDAASKKYDLEAWFPGYDAYRQLVSVSNCTDFQSRNLNIRCGIKKKDVLYITIQDIEKRYVHLLNGTLCATERTLCCILENYQTEDGLRVPEVLQPYVGTDFIPYIEEKKKEKKPEPTKETKPKKEKKQGKQKDAKPKEEGQDTSKLTGEQQKKEQPAEE